MYDKQVFAFLENSPVSIFIFNESLEIQEVNQAFCALTGKKRETLISCPLFTAINREFYNEFVIIFNLLKQNNKKAISREKWITVAETKQFCYSIIINSGPINDGEKFYISFIENITELKNAEKKLEEAKDIAERATKAKSEFIAKASHEIRAPLQAIVGMSELMLDTALNAEQEEYGTQILFSAEVLSSLVNDILDFSKIEAGKLELETIDFDLYKTVEDAITLVAMEAHKKGLEVILSISPKVPKVINGDPVRLRQIITNLLGNAIKFTEKGEVAVSVLVENHSSGEMIIKFLVRDTGVGIPENRKHLLFDVYSQIDISVSRKFGGTGLGLVICKQLVELFDGQIGVESAEGQGSVFWFTIKSGASHLPKEFPMPGTKLSHTVGVLLVDDNETSRKQIKSCLEEIDIKVFEAESGAMALEFLQNSGAAPGDQIELMIIDQRMPGMDGWQLASEINTSGRFHDIKKILMTPIGMGGNEAKMKLLNWFDGYINKPIKKNTLYNTLFTALDIVIDIDEEENIDTEQDIKVVEELISSSKKRVLVAEDYYVNQKLFKMLLENLQIEVEMAVNGMEAVELASEKKFDLILMDIQMPVMSGLDAAKKIREMGIETPIIAVTASTIASDAEAFLKAGMDDYLAKPFKKSDLVQLFGKWIISEDSFASLEELGAVEEPRQKHIQDSSFERAPQSEADIETIFSNFPADTGDGIENIEILLESTDMPLTENEEIFNYDEALEVFLGEKDIVLEILEEFEKKIRTQLANMKALLQKEDFEALSREAHSLKGGSWNLAMTKFGNAAEKLEKSAKSREITASLENLKTLIIMYPKLSREILSVLQKERFRS
ncbi:MAG: response regulator [Spirochaetes bacterium]|nr:response regulator [Spirochaetota bacterium]